MRQTFLTLTLALALVLSLSALAAAEDWRLEGAVGLNYGEAGARDENINGTEVDGSIGTGNGFTGAVNLWKDRMFADWFSLGAAYSFRSNKMNYHTTGSGGTSQRMNTDIMMNDFQIKAAARKNDGDIHPYIGAGLGFSYMNGKISVDGGSQERGETFAPTLSAFVGYDYDINETYYTGLDVAYTYSTGEVVGIQVYHNTLGAMFKLGMKF
ncbi:hypothetical protein DND132_1892 [Pseudodesulfovibrio mercurii]|uniref:Outer membrane protein beta-barrel domain-containing protein n=1 Tax=Pseudodesulfovibrio mercurii TaxID=641491 RepID=F0JGI1_9BACT|nr:outer membrane beta-barrel protein [Pseudodesulfovibrio mercurii]EGB15098.1 hypothetical protein DND132_1892 [Pseudodesulfovibrio mercurii]